MNLRTILPLLAATGLSAIGFAQTTIIHPNGSSVTHRRNGTTVVRHVNGTTVVHPTRHARRRVVIARHRPYRRHPRVIVVHRHY